MENLLIRGLTEEEQQMLKELQLKDAREEGREAGRAEGIAEGRAEGIELGIAEAKLEAVDKIAADGTISAEKACELLEVSLEDYLKWKTEKEN